MLLSDTNLMFFCLPCIHSRLSRKLLNNDVEEGLKRSTVPLKSIISLLKVLVQRESLLPHVAVLIVFYGSHPSVILLLLSLLLEGWELPESLMIPLMRVLKRLSFRLHVLARKLREFNLLRELYSKLNMETVNATSGS